MHITDAAWEMYRKYGGASTRKTLDTLAKRFRIKIVSEDEWGTRRSKGKRSGATPPTPQCKAGSKGHGVQLQDSEQGI